MSPAGRENAGGASNGPAAVRVLDDPQQLTEAFARDFSEWVGDLNGTVNVALSGGSTPLRLFQYWAGDNGPRVDWKRVHFFWGDERCVPADHADSNFAAANRLFFQPDGIDPAHIHRIRGEDVPETEASRYAAEIRNRVPMSNGIPNNGIPRFDIMILGLGSDGHTASLFPDRMELLDSNDICTVAVHPETGQKRITLTGPVIASAARIVFLVTGEAKAEKVAAILDNKPASIHWPASRFFHLPCTTIYLDKEANRLHQAGDCAG